MLDEKGGKIQDVLKTPDRFKYAHRYMQFINGRSKKLLVPLGPSPPPVYFLERSLPMIDNGRSRCTA